MSDTNAVLDSFTAGTDAALAEAVDGLAWCALVMANRKLILTPVVPRPARAAARECLNAADIHIDHPVSREAIDAYRLLSGAWYRVPDVATRYGLAPQALTEALENYVTALLTAGFPHHFDNVPRLLAQLKVSGR